MWRPLNFYKLHLRRVDVMVLITRPPNTDVFGYTTAYSTFQVQATPAYPSLQILPTTLAFYLLKMPNGRRF